LFIGTVEVRAQEEAVPQDKIPKAVMDALLAKFPKAKIDKCTKAKEGNDIVYDQGNGMYASRFWWMLRYMGHNAAAVLDGGWAAWTREGFPTRGGDERRAAATFVGQPRRGFSLTVADVEAIAGSDTTLLVDARAPERFEGRTEPLDRVAGHIPGAVNHAFASNVAENGTMLPVEVLRSQFQATLGDRAPSQVVMYCGSGVTACQNLLAMEHAGLGGARLYPGSWSEWSSDPGRPVEQGPSRRT
jgi:thiosulfate/3-mercaptopyruvate sulfurtransferase